MGTRIVLNTVFQNPIETFNWRINRDDVISMDLSNLAKVVNPGTSYGFADVEYQKLQGRTLKQIKLLPCSAGKLSIVKFSANALTTRGVATLLQELQITSEMVDNPTTFDLDIPVGDNDIIGIGLETDTAGIYYNNDSSLLGEDHIYIRLDNSTQVPTAGYSIMAVSWATN